VSDQKVFDYPGDKIDVQWDGRLCIHIGECGNAEGSLFVAGRDPWCLPDQASRDEVREIVERCPSGALTYRDHEGTPEPPPEENTVLVVYNGPLYLSGDLDIAGAPGDMAGVRFRAALCRCGQSGNKPFCDNSHLSAGFQDFGAVGEQGPGVEADGGKLSVKPLPNGPLLVEGNLSILAGSARVAWQGTKAALCRCGASGNKPFCDGSHAKVGFSSE
jgi:CDGSH-type Zn-finger protein/uncharacterized Fe-S cluster protein YjdI